MPNSTEDLPYILTWAPDEDLSAKVENEFLVLLSEALGLCLATIARKDPSNGDSLRKAVFNLPDHSLRRLLLAPETSSRLLWPEHRSVKSALVFLEDAALAEMARCGLKTVHNMELWTALGDWSISLTDATSSAALIGNGIPVDFLSPNSTDFSGMAETEQMLLDRFNDAQIDLLLLRLRSALDAITTCSIITAEFVTRFTSVLMVHKSMPDRARFMSRSPGRRIGLTVFQDPHLESVDESDLAESFIHEATHSMLDMVEAVRKYRGDPWIKDENLNDGLPRTLSPWSGRPLTLPAFVHACFVWFGLLNFWCRAKSAAVFPPLRIRQQISRAAAGFLGKPLVDQLKPHSSAIAEDLKEIVHSMQKYVSSCFDNQ